MHDYSWTLRIQTLHQECYHFLVPGNSLEIFQPPKGWIWLKHNFLWVQFSSIFFSNQNIILKNITKLQKRIQFTNFDDSLCHLIPHSQPGKITLFLFIFCIWIPPGFLSLCVSLSLTNTHICSLDHGGFIPRPGKTFLYLQAFLSQPYN